MIIFMAGNFPLMLKPEEERKMRDAILEMGRDYNRLLSFYYKQGALNVLEIKEEADGWEPHQKIKN